MKLIVKKPAVKGATPKTAPVKPAAKNGETKTPHISRSNFDKGLFFVGNRIPTAVIQKEALGTEVPKLTKSGFLLLHGNKPGILVLPVHHNGKGIYSRVNERGNTIYGVLSAINEKSEAISAEIVDLAELLGRAIAHKKAVKVTRVSDQVEFTVALLNSFGDQYVAGIAVDADGVAPINMEHVVKWNKKTVQFTDQKDIPFSVITKLLAAHA